MATSWWRRMFGAFGIVSHRKKQPWTRNRLHIEALEDRLAPATSIAFNAGTHELTITIGADNETATLSVVGADLSVSSNQGTTSDGSLGFAAATGNNVANTGSIAAANDVRLINILGAGGTQTVVFAGGTFTATTAGADGNIDNVQFTTAASTFAQISASASPTADLTITANAAVLINQNVLTGNVIATDTPVFDRPESGSITITAGTGITGSGRLITGDATLDGANDIGIDRATSGSISLTVTGTGDIGLSAVHALTVGSRNRTGAVGNVDSAVAGSMTLSADRINNGTPGSALSVFQDAASSPGFANSDLGLLHATTDGGAGAAGEIQLTTDSGSILNIGTLDTANGSSQTVNLVSTNGAFIRLAGGAKNLDTDAVTLNASGNLVVLAGSSLTAGSVTAIGSRITLGDTVDADTTVDLIGNLLDINAVVTAGTSISVRQITNGRLIDLGDNTNNNTRLALDATEVDNLHAPTVSIGNANSGSITIAGAVTPGNLTTLNLTTGGSISDGTTGLGGNLLTVDNLNLSAPSGTIDVNFDVNNITATSGGNQFLEEADTATIAAAGLNAGSDTISLGDGTFSLGGAGRIADASTLDVLATAIFRLDSFSETIGGLTGTGSIRNGNATAAILTIDRASGAQTFSGVLGGSGSPNNNFSLVKAGGSTLALGGDNTYSGATTVNGGTLLVNGSLVAASAVTVNNAATLGGTGDINGTVQLNDTARLAPGTSAGILNTGSVTFGATTNFDVEINGTNPATPDFDQLIVTGTATLGGANLNLSGTHVFVAGNSFTIIDATVAVTGTFAGLPDNAKFFRNNQPLTIDYTPTSVVISFDPNPEINGSDGVDDDIRVSMNGANVVVTVNGTTVLDTPLAGLSSLTINGLGGDDTLLVDSSSGIPIPAGGLTYDGGAAGNDKLAVKGSGTQNAIYTPDAAVQGNGTVTVNGQTITFTGLEPVDIFGMLTATLMTPLTGANDTLTVTNGFNLTAAAGAVGTIPALVVSGTTGDTTFAAGDGTAIETVAFFDNTTVVINTTMTDGADQITIASANNVHDNLNLTITTGAGADNLIVNGAVIITGSLTSTFTASTPRVNLNNNITAAIITGTATTVNVNNATAQIQDGIDVAAAGTTVTIAAGTFAENVLVNKGVTLDGAGVTTIIDPTADGDAIRVTADNVTIRDLRVTGTTGAGSDGIHADTVSNLTLNNVRADNNADDGFALSNITSLGTLTSLVATGNAGDGFDGSNLNAGATVTFSGGSFTTNTGNGIILNGSANIIATSVTATGNSAGASVSGAASFSDTGGNYSSNTSHGIALQDITGLASLAGTTLNDNGGDGLNATDTAADADTLAVGSLTLSGVTIRDTVASNTQQHGVSVGDIGGPVTLNDNGVTPNTVTGNTAGGVTLGNVSGGVAITSTNSATYSSNTGGDGINIASLTGVLTVSGITANSNAGDGLDVGDGGTTAGISSSTFSSNTSGSGINLNSTGGSFTGAVTLSSVNANINSGQGLVAPLAVALNTIDGSHFDGNARGMLLTSGTLTVTDSTFSNNTIAGNGAGINITGGSLTLTNVTLAGNSATGAGGQGGGVNFADGTGHAINNSTINNNTAANGAGINLANTFAGTLTITNSTISTNIGTGMTVAAGVANLRHVTVAFNFGAGVDVAAAGTVNAGNSLFASNNGNTNTSNTLPDFNGAVVSEGSNLFQSSSGLAGAVNGVNGDKVGVLARLAALANYGGTTLTHALLPGSFALNGVTVDTTPIAVDQRGVARPLVGKDIGAFESRGFTVTRIALTNGAGVNDRPAGDDKFRTLITKPFVGANGSTPLQFAAQVTADPLDLLTDLTGGALLYVVPTGEATPAAPQTRNLATLEGHVNSASDTVTASSTPGAPTTFYSLFATADPNTAPAVAGPNLTDWRLFNQKVDSLFYNIPTGDTNPAAPQNTQSGEVTRFKSGNGSSSTIFTVTLMDQDTPSRRVVITGEKVSLLPKNTITDVTPNVAGLGPIIITSAGHGLTTNGRVAISGVEGNTAANGLFTITVLNANQFRLNGTLSNGAYTGGGTVSRAITAMTGAGVSPIVVTSPRHGLKTGQQVTISGVQGNTNANGTFTITFVDANRFRLNGTTGNGVYTGGGVIDLGLINAIDDVPGFPAVTLTGGTASTTTVSGVARFMALQIFRSTFASPYVMKAFYTNPDSDVADSVSSRFRVLPRQFAVIGGNFAGAFQTAFNITVARSSRGQVRLVSLVSGQNGLGTNQLKVQAFDFFAPNVVTPATSYDGPTFLTFSVTAKSIGPNVMLFANVPTQFTMKNGVLFLPNVTTVAPVPSDGFTVAAELGLTTGVPAPNTPFLMDPAGFVLVNAGVPESVFIGKFTRLNLGRLRRR